MIVSQLSGDCDVINNRLWRHQQNVNLVSEARGRCLKIVVFIVFCIVVMSYKRWNKICSLVTTCFCAHSSVILVSGNKHQNKPLVSAETVCHSSTYIILYIVVIFSSQKAQRIRFPNFALVPVCIQRTFLKVNSFSVLIQSKRCAWSQSRQVVGH